MSAVKEAKINLHRHGAMIWNWLMANNKDFPAIMPPPFKIVYYPRGHKFTQEEKYLLGKIDTLFYEDDNILEISDYKLNIYPEAIENYLREVFEDSYTRLTAQMVTDHVIVHEYCHFYRNYMAWLPMHQDNDIEYEICRKDFKKYIIRGGSFHDEDPTEKLAIKFLSKMYGVDLALKPVYTGRYAKFMNKCDPKHTYTERLCLINMMQFEHLVSYEDDDDRRDEMIRKWIQCRFYLRDLAKDKGKVKVVFK